MVCWRHSLASGGPEGLLEDVRHCLASTVVPCLLKPLSRWLADLLSQQRGWLRPTSGTSELQSSLLQNGYDVFPAELL